jgi:hypothetical protein
MDPTAGSKSDIREPSEEEAPSNRGQQHDEERSASLGSNATYALNEWHEMHEGNRHPGAAAENGD